MNTTSTVLPGILLLGALAGAAGPAAAADEAQISRGRYVIATSGCNDCHTPDYAQSGGAIPVDKWLTGSPIGFQGPWGTTYPANLRLTVHQLTPEQWLHRARTPMRPPMPWFSLRDMSDDDLLAVYAFVHSLEPVGKAAPAYAPPGKAVTTPYYEFMPKNLPMTAHSGK